ncbi:hypothetical protein EVAR_40187_1 [Eumeta japonica]|uniref:Uncharacterized protein n=1 Tax=Eumeta variegata TaxID=151549 RepID=A0A4C1XJ44_EUMVA|nr:hypothetical protein EVAR_40187_1 [Eumeta japonica]
MDKQSVKRAPMAERLALRLRALRAIAFEDIFVLYVISRSPQPRMRSVCSEYSYPVSPRSGVNNDRKEVSIDSIMRNFVVSAYPSGE